MFVSDVGQDSAHTLHHMRLPDERPADTGHGVAGRAAKIRSNSSSFAYLCYYRFFSSFLKKTKNERWWGEVGEKRTYFSDLDGDKNIFFLSIIISFMTLKGRYHVV